jgi:hypothetical protein
MISKMSHPPLKNLLLKEINDASYAGQLARVHYAAFRDNALNMTMYPMHDKDTVVPWLEERQRRNIFKDGSTTIALIDPSMRPDDGDNSHNHSYEGSVVAYARWTILRKLRTSLSEHDESSAATAGSTQSVDDKTRVQHAEPQAQRQLGQSSSSPITPDPAATTPTTTALELSQKYNVPPFPEGTNISLVIKFRELLARYRNIFFEDVKDKDDIWCKL